MEDVRDLYCFGPNWGVPLGEASPAAAANQEEEGFLPTGEDLLLLLQRARHPRASGQGRGPEGRVQGLWSQMVESVPALLCSSNRPTLGDLIQLSEPIAPSSRWRELSLQVAVDSK